MDSKIMGSLSKALKMKRDKFWESPIKIKQNTKPKNRKFKDRANLQSRTFVLQNNEIKSSFISQ